VPQDNRFIISKGNSRDFDAYSGFQGTILDSLLRERGIKRVFVGGVATDYCVRNTVLGAINLGYQAFLLLDAIKGVDLNVGDSERAVEEMLLAGAVGVQIEDLA
ncbi:MAG: isochorismatase family protein, partial [Aquificaceae bacterium]|nr:isochorismatase family protein [Aquificaceae bacterium]